MCAKWQTRRFQSDYSSDSMDSYQVPSYGKSPTPLRSSSLLQDDGPKERPGDDARAREREREREKSLHTCVCICCSLYYVPRASYIVYSLFICVYNNTIFIFLLRPLRLRKLHHHIAVQQYFSTFISDLNILQQLQLTIDTLYWLYNRDSATYWNNTLYLFVTDFSYIFPSYSACFLY